MGKNLKIWINNIMDTFDLFLQEFSFRFPKGYLDMENENDFLILENILRDIGLKEAFNPLTFFDLKKRGGPRFRILADKISSGEPFNMVNGESHKLLFAEPKYKSAFEEMDGDKIKELSKGSINIFPFFKNNEGEEFGIADILKDSSFGGRGQGSGTAVEDHNLKLLNNEIIKAMEENDNKPITVVFNGESYEDITGAVSQAGFPKADFYLIDSGGHPQMFISHKKAGAKGPAANDFIRWSGYTMYADNPEVKEFNNALESFLVENDLDGLPNKTRFISPIKDKELIRKLIYGPKYGEKTGPDNVDVIFQGKIFLTQKSPGTYEISSEHTEIPPSIPEGEYYPYMTSSYRGDRMMFGIKNNEAIVMTKSVSYSSSNIYELKNGKFVKVK